MIRDLFHPNFITFDRFFKSAALAAVLLLSACSSPDASPAGSLEIHFIDVGYGDAILLRRAEAGVLIDTGYAGTGPVLTDYFQEHGVDVLDHLIVTHPHGDHAGAAVEIAEKFPLRRVWDNGQPITRFFPRFTAAMVRRYEEEFRGRADYGVLKRGDRIRWGDVRLEVLWPPDTDTFDDWNTNSLVIMVEYGSARALLTGDLNLWGEDELLKIDPAALAAEILKVGHHGAGDATGPDFLEAVSPDYAVISVGPNPWGFPSREVIERLREAGVRLFRTDRDGDIVFGLGPAGEIEIIPPDR